jgi:hypothetical protein
MDRRAWAEAGLAFLSKLLGENPALQGGFAGES